MLNQIELESAESQSQKYSPLESGIESARAYLFSIQHEAGFWCGELEGDTILESEYILTMYFLGYSEDPRVAKAASYIREKALPEGGWAIYPGGPAEVSASSKAYFVLKLLGDDPNAPHMAKARKAILNLGGLAAVNSFTRIYLALFGQFPWDDCPAVPPEIVLLSPRFPINIHEMSSWSRGILIPLSVIWAVKPHVPVPAFAGIDELWGSRAIHSSKPMSFWGTVFRITDVLLKTIENQNWHPWRNKALKECEQWMLEHFQDSDGIGAIFPPIINSIIALRCLGYQNEHPVLQSQIRELEKLELESEDTLKIAPCYSPVWDTALAITALTASGVSGSHPALLKAAEWILSKEVKKVGDWKVKNPEGSPGGWYFEFANEFYPDVDDTFQVVTALTKIHFSQHETENRKREAIDRALSWLLSMQNKDGGWASFDRDCGKNFLTLIPFADHKAMIDPSTSDITARGLETLALCKLGKKETPVIKGIRFLQEQQEADGSWFGRWGCNYIYGTWLALYGLNQIGADMSEPWIDKAANWLRSVQNEDGGWGELPRSYEDPSYKGKGPSTPSQTAWALMGLMSASDKESDEVLNGIDYLINAQQSDGSWQDEHWTGTGFPEVFYLRYHLYATFFPLMALSIYENRSSRMSSS